MGFGAGTLISAISYELIFEAVKIGRGTGFPAYGFFVGAFTFYFSDMLIAKLGATKSSTSAGAQYSHGIGHYP
ncbi:hypothetical protein [Flavobacterium sp. M31R6]|uniref:hypothetical protein n=1 Tax=Flavobacterium sp. M31R6 TaxID=2739062 RepID=UPI00156901D0|nr:hypothetical protein [Flavobacterium sp. M31R6]QKJ64320.1 hypothetical protein HQN62_14670 [Flavobacterium sp. M31R6]